MTAPTSTSSPVPKPRRGLIIALVISMAVNLLLGGAILGRVLMGPPPGPMPNHLGWIIRDLDTDTRKQLKPLLVEHARKAMPLRQEMRQAQRAFRQALLTEPLDESELTASLERLQTASAAFQDTMHKEMLVILKQLSPAERARVATFLHRPGRHGNREPRD
jgi:uncharacterized membrane protein